jgi:hypothetical protein
LTLDKAGLVHDENEHFKKTCTRIESQLKETTRIDDDIKIFDISSTPSALRKGSTRREKQLF